MPDSTVVPSGWIKLRTLVVVVGVVAAVEEEEAGVVLVEVEAVEALEDPLEVDMVVSNRANRSIKP